MNFIPVRINQSIKTSFTINELWGLNFYLYRIKISF